MYSASPQTTLSNFGWMTHTGRCELLAFTRIRPHVGVWQAPAASGGFWQGLARWMHFTPWPTRSVLPSVRGRRSVLPAPGSRAWAELVSGSRGQSLDPSGAPSTLTRSSLFSTALTQGGTESKQQLSNLAEVSGLLLLVSVSVSLPHWPLSLWSGCNGCSPLGQTGWHPMKKRGVFFLIHLHFCWDLPRALQVGLSHRCTSSLDRGLEAEGHTQTPDLWSHWVLA